MSERDPIELSPELSVMLEDLANRPNSGMTNVMRQAILDRQQLRQRADSPDAAAPEAPPED